MEKVPDSQKTFADAMDLLKKGRPIDAAGHLEKIMLSEGDNSAICSWLGVALARSGSDMQRAEKLGLMAVEKDPYVPQYHINLAEIYNLGGNKWKAVDLLQRSLEYDTKNGIIERELDKYGRRRPPVIPYLSRSNPVNKYIGIFMTRLGLRK